MKNEKDDNAAKNLLSINPRKHENLGPTINKTIKEQITIVMEHLSK